MTALLNEGADVNAQTEDGWTALHHAADEGHAEVETVLQEAGATVSDPPCFMAGTEIATPTGICLWKISRPAMRS